MMNGRCLVFAFAALVALCAASCGDDEEPAAPADMVFAAGEFEILTTQVEDGCLDGGLNLLFMPNGQSEPWLWPFPVTVYGPDALPKTYEIQLRDPFGPMTVSASYQGDGQESFVIETNPSVPLGEESYGQCVVDLDGVVAVSLVDADNVLGFASLVISDPRGDERCPVDMPTSCDVRLSFEGVRAR